MKLTTEQLANYLINNDFEIQIMNNDYKTIARALPDDDIIATTQQIKDAVKLANNDLYIEQLRYKHYSHLAK